MSFYENYPIQITLPFTNLTEYSKIVETKLVIKDEIYLWLYDNVGAPHSSETWAWYQNFEEQTITFCFCSEDMASFFMLTWC